MDFSVVTNDNFQNIALKPYFQYIPYSVGFKHILLFFFCFDSDLNIWFDDWIFSCQYKRGLIYLFSSHLFFVLTVSVCLFITRKFHEEYGERCRRQTKKEDCKRAKGHWCVNLCSLKCKQFAGLTALLDQYPYKFCIVYCVCTSIQGQREWSFCPRRLRNSCEVLQWRLGWATRHAAFVHQPSTSEYFQPYIFYLLNATVKTQILVTVCLMFKSTGLHQARKVQGSHRWLWMGPEGKAYSYRLGFSQSQPHSS